MHCYFQLDAGKWVKGDASTINGVRDLMLSSMDGKTITILQRVELQIGGRHMYATGMVEDGEKRFRWCTADIVFDKRYAKD